MAGFTHDVFLCHSSADKDVVRDLAVRLRDSGLRVWFEEWEVHPGDSVPARVEQGLEGSAVLVLCMSAATFGSEWVAIEAETFRFRDPLNKERRFVPVRLDDTEPSGSLSQFLYVDWRGRSDIELERLTLACRPSEEAGALSAAATSTGGADRPVVLSLGHTELVSAVAVTADGALAVSGSADHTLRVWDLVSGTCERVLLGHTDCVWAVGISADVARIVSGSDDRTLRVWNLASGVCEAVLVGHTSGVRAVAMTPDGARAVSASDDRTVRVWNLSSGACELVLEGHTERVLALAITADGARIVTGSDDRTLRVWSLATGACERVLRGHVDRVWAVAVTPDGARAVSGSGDGKLRVWNLASGKCEQVLEGHVDWVLAVAVSADGDQAVSGSADRTVRTWRLASGTCERVLEGHTAGVRAVAPTADFTRVVSGSGDCTVRVWGLVSGASERVLADHTAGVMAVAFTADLVRMVSASADRRLRVWNLESGVCERILVGHTDRVWAIAVTPDGSRAVSGSADRTLRVWDLSSGTCERVAAAHTGGVLAVAVTADGAWAVTGSRDGALHVWDLNSGGIVRMLAGHRNSVVSVAVTADGTRAVSGSADRTLRVWDLETGTCERVLEGHTDEVLALAIKADGTSVVSGSADRTLRIWDLGTGTCEWVLEGHTASVLAVATTDDGLRVLSGSDDRTLRVWNLESGMCDRVLDNYGDSVVGTAFSADRGLLSVGVNGVLQHWPAVDTVGVVAPVEAQVSYSNAKVVLVGEHHAGKTGLAQRLALRQWEPSESTLGATQIPLPSLAADGTEREIWLWDFGGQADQRLVHQLFVTDAAVAVFVYDGDRDDALIRLWDWSRSMRSAAPRANRILAAGRIDVNPVRISRAQLDELVAAEGFVARFETSAKGDVGCDELRQTIEASIDWARMPTHTSPAVFKRIKDAVVELRDRRTFVGVKELRDLLPAQTGIFDDAQLDAVIGLLAGPGFVLRLGWGDLVLLHPELLNTYAQVVVRSLRGGCITEERVLRGDLEFPVGEFERLPEAEESMVLRAMHHQLLDRELCLRDEDPDEQRPTVLVFPSEFRTDRPPRPNESPSFVSFPVTGHLREVWATLAVRIHHSQPFRKGELWRNAANFVTPSGREIGLRLVIWPDGRGDVEVTCEPDTPLSEQALFARYVQDHLRGRDADVKGLRTYRCPQCATPVENRDAAYQRLLRGDKDMACPLEERHRIPLRDDLAELLFGDELQLRAEELRRRAEVVLDSESRERVLVGDVVTIAANANQIAREFTVSDHGIDMEIEFKDDEGQATGRKIYLQLKSGDSHLRERKRDGARIFRIDKTRHSDHWANQGFPVYLVIRDSDGTIEWMEVRELLRRQRASGPWPATDIRFEGEPFDVMALRRVRERMLAPD